MDFDILPFLLVFSMLFKPLHQLLIEAGDTFSSVLGILITESNESHNKEYEEMNRLNTILEKYGYMAVDGEVIQANDSSKKL